MNLLNGLLFIIFGIAAVWDIAIIFSTLKNRLARNGIPDLTGLLGRVVHLSTLVASVNTRFNVNFNLAINFIFLLYNFFYISQISSSLLIAYTVISVVLGGMYFHLHFVKNSNHDLHWYTAQEGWTSNLNEQGVDKQFYYQILLDNFFSLLIINIPLAMISIF